MLSKMEQRIHDLEKDNAKRLVASMLMHQMIDAGVVKQTDGSSIVVDGPNGSQEFRYQQPE